MKSLKKFIEPTIFNNSRNNLISLWKRRANPLKNSFQKITQHFQLIPISFSRFIGPLEHQKLGKKLQKWFYLPLGHSHIWTTKSVPKNIIDNKKQIHLLKTLNIKVTNKIHTISNGLLQFEKRAAAPGISKSYLIKCLNSFFNSFSSLTESFLMNSFARKILTQKTNCERKNFPKNFHVWGFSMNELFMWMFCGLFTIK